MTMTMTDTDHVAFPALLRAARRTYGSQVRRALAHSGYDDLPANGPFVLGAITRTGSPLAEVIAALGLSKQAAGALVDALVVRGYLVREIDPQDRRRLRVAPTERGIDASELTAAAVAAVDDRLLDRVGPADVAAARRALWALIGLGSDDAAADHGSPDGIGPAADGTGEVRGRG